MTKKQQMKFGFLAILMIIICSCKKEKATPYISLQDTEWNWISTTQDSTFYEDTASSNSQHIKFVDYKTIEWKRNDSVFFSGNFIYKTKESVLTGSKKPIMTLNGMSYGYVVTQLNDTLWLREDIASGSRTYRYLKMN